MGCCSSKLPAAAGPGEVLRVEIMAVDNVSESAAADVATVFQRGTAGMMEGTLHFCSEKMLPVHLVSEGPPPVAEEQTVEALADLAAAAAASGAAGGDADAPAAAAPDAVASEMPTGTEAGAPAVEAAAAATETEAAASEAVALEAAAAEVAAPGAAAPEAAAPEAAAPEAAAPEAAAPEAAAPEAAAPEAAAPEAAAPEAAAPEAAAPEAAAPEGATPAGPEGASTATQEEGAEEGAETNTSHSRRGSARSSVSTKSRHTGGKGPLLPHEMRFVVRVSVVGAEGTDVVTDEVRKDSPTFNQVLEITGDKMREWDLKKVSLKFELCYRGAKNVSSVVSSQLKGTFFRYSTLGQVTMSIADLLKPGDHRLPNGVHRLLLEDSGTNALIISSGTPPKPAELLVKLALPLPTGWPAMSPPSPLEADRKFPRHIFMMTRGTRGDVQPFVALARGMASQKGYLVTICTEHKFRDFVLSKGADVTDGEIRFLPSGGDTETQKDALAERTFLKVSDSVIAQMIMIAASEYYFFSSIPVFAHQLDFLMKRPKPVDMIIPGFTMVGGGMLLSELYQVPMGGFILQPSSIPSKDQDWRPVEAITAPKERDSLGTMIGLDFAPRGSVASHANLAVAKKFVEEFNPGGTTMTSLRKSFGLEPRATWPALLGRNVPMVIPMQPQAFSRPVDWPSRFTMTDFIFLRPSKPTAGQLTDELQAFIDANKAKKRPIIAMSFSSMPVERSTVLKCIERMLTKAKVVCSLVYIGKPGSSPKAIKELEAAGRFFEAARADFGELFKHIDCFIVHGGLGTTVEALRMKKPIAITGPLLLDQRFWGKMIERKGVGPPPVFLSDFPGTCVQFVNDALCEGSAYLKAAEALDWGKETDDGVEPNVDCFVKFLDEEVEPIDRHYPDDGARHTILGGMRNSIMAVNPARRNS